MSFEKAQTTMAHANLGNQKIERDIVLFKLANGNAGV